MARVRNQTRVYHQTARAHAAEETGNRIVHAFVKRLLSQWYDEITLDRVAEDAGVTVQTVVRRFGGKDGLLKEAAEVIAVDINSRRATDAVDEQSHIRQLLRDYEEIGDSIIRLLALEDRHPQLKRLLDFGREQHRDWVKTVFSRRLKDADEARRTRILDAFVVATDVYTWKLLCRDMGRSSEEAARIMLDMVEVHRATSRRLS